MDVPEGQPAAAEVAAPAPAGDRKEGHLPLPATVERLEAMVRQLEQQCAASVQQYHRTLMGMIRVYATLHDVSDQLRARVEADRESLPVAQVLEALAAHDSSAELRRQRELKFGDFVSPLPADWTRYLTDESVQFDAPVAGPWQAHLHGDLLLPASAAAAAVAAAPAESHLEPAALGCCVCKQGLRLADLVADRQARQSHRLLPTRFWRNRDELKREGLTPLYVDMRVIICGSCMQKDAVQVNISALKRIHQIDWVEPHVPYQRQQATVRALWAVLARIDTLPNAEAERELYMLTFSRHERLAKARAMFPLVYATRTVISVNVLLTAVLACLLGIVLSKLV